MLEREFSNIVFIAKEIFKPRMWFLYVSSEQFGMSEIV